MHGGVVEAIAVIIESCFGIVVLGAEPVPEVVGHGAGLGYGATEGVVDILRYDNPLPVDISGYVSVGVVEWEVPCAIERNGKQSADAASAL
ncbi:MAG: hypothetical protein BWY72_02405 [Bacteroidetes bacterium ADurb.Bin416]|nr:MAG: hypothetical protein BWY72_02405 [Bacteroidetes bacterium ADurb.Bin416]